MVVPKSLLGSQDPSLSPRLCLGVVGSLMGCLCPSRGAWVCFGVPGSPLGCQNQFQDAWVCFGVQTPILGHQSPFWGGRVCFGMPGSVPSLFGMPESILGCLGPFLGSHPGVPGSILGCPRPSGGALWAPLLSGCCCTPKHPGAPWGPTLGWQRPRLGVPAPPIGLGASGSRSGFLGLLVAEIWGHRAWRGLGAVLGSSELSWRVLTGWRGRGEPPKSALTADFVPRQSWTPPGARPTRDGGSWGWGGLRADLGVPPWVGGAGGVHRVWGCCRFWGVSGARNQCWQRIIN